MNLILKSITDELISVKAEVYQGEENDKQDQSELSLSRLKAVLNASWLHD